MDVRVYVDFNTMMIDGTDVDIRKDGVGQVNPTIVWFLKRGMHIIIYDEDMEVEATVVGENDSLWFAKPNWATRRDFKS